MKILRLLLLTLLLPLGQAQDMASLIDQLGDPAYKLRAAAAVEIETALSTNYVAHEEALLSAMFTLDDPEITKSLTPILEAAAKHHYFARTNKGFIGVTLMMGNFIDGAKKRTPAVRITSIYTNTPASRAGLRTNDMVIALDSRRIEPWMQTDDFIRAVQRRGPGEKLLLHVVRPDGIHRLEMVLGARPPQIRTAVNTRIYTTAYGYRTADSWYESWIRANRLRFEQMAGSSPAR